MYTLMHMCKYATIYACMCVYIYIYIYMCVCVCVCVCTPCALFYASCVSAGIAKRNLLHSMLISCTRKLATTGANANQFKPNLTPTHSLH